MASILCFSINEIFKNYVQQRKSVIDQLNTAQHSFVYTHITCFLFFFRYDWIMVNELSPRDFDVVKLSADKADVGFNEPTNR